MCEGNERQLLVFTTDSSEQSLFPSQGQTFIDFARLRGPEARQSALQIIPFAAIALGLVWFVQRLVG